MLILADPSLCLENVGNHQVEYAVLIACEIFTCFLQLRADGIGGILLGM